MLINIDLEKKIVKVNSKMSVKDLQELIVLCETNNWKIDCEVQHLPDLFESVNKVLPCESPAVPFSPIPYETTGTPWIWTWTYPHPTT